MLLLTNLLSFMSGSFIKLYDDIKDNYNMNDNSLPLEMLKVTIIGINTLWLYNDVFSAIIFLFGLFPSIYYNGALNNNFWLAFFFIPIICILFNSYKLFNEETNYPLLIVGGITVIVINIFTFLEHQIFKEEISKYKSYIRYSFVILCTISIILLRNLSLMKIIMPLVLCEIGYIITNILFQNILL